MQARLGMLSLMLVVQVAAAQSLPAGRAANLSDPGDLALLELNGDKVSGQTVVNDCDTPVRPMLDAPAPDMAVVVEADPTGLCSGSNLPSSVAIMLRKQGTWRIDASSPGTGFRLAAVHDGHPDVLIQAPTQRNCPTLGWTGQAYRVTHTCAGTHP